MGKRSSFERKKHDAYYSPYEVVPPLLPFLPKKVKFIEPCAGDGRLIRHLEKHEHECLYACDLDPQAYWIEKRDILFFDELLPECDMIISNTPWEREILHPMIERFRTHAPTWLLFDAGWMFTEQAKPYLEYCEKIVTIGRVKWIEGSSSQGMEDCCWYHFIPQKTETKFYGKK